MVGADKVARLFAAGLAAVGGDMTTDVVPVNGWPALLLRMHEQIDSVMSLCVQDGLVSGIYTVRNPQKLTRMTQITVPQR